MQYILIFGVVFVIMQAVILLFFFMISSAAEDVAGQIRKTFLKEMEVFDELYEEKAAKLKKVQEEYERFNSNILKKTEEKPKQEAAARPVAAISSMSDIPAARLMSRDFAQNYRSIRRSFCPDTAAVLDTVAQMAAPDRKMVQYSALLKKLNEKLTFNTVFTLTGLKPSDQETVLRSVLDAEEQAVLQQFLDRNRAMDIVAFREWIQSESFLNNPDPVLYTGNAQEVPQGNITVHEEESICEGVRVLQSGKMYDYSL